MISYRQFPKNIPRFENILADHKNPKARVFPAVIGDIVSIGLNAMLF